MSEHQDCSAVRNSVVAATGVIHGKGQRVACLATDVAEKKLVQAGVDCTVALAAAMLEGGCCACLFGVCKAWLSNVFVTDLKLGAHELNKAHLVNKENVGFLEDFDIGDCAPGGGKTHTVTECFEGWCQRH